MFLNEGQTLTMRDALLGLAVPSGNDVAVAAALAVAPSMEDFAALMNQEARDLGLDTLHFVESSGISEHNLISARDFARFCRYYIASHPETLKELHSVPQFAYPRAENMPAGQRSRPTPILQTNHNNLLIDFPGTDGLKTGFINESGYNIALTAEREGTRFITVILGARSTRTRDSDGRNLLQWAFENYKTIRPEIPPLDAVQVWKGALDAVPIAPLEPLAFTAPANRAEGELVATSLIQTPLLAPLEAGATVGTLIFRDASGELRRIPLVTLIAIEEGNFFKRTWDSVQLFFQS